MTDLRFIWVNLYGCELTGVHCPDHQSATISDMSLTIGEAKLRAAEQARHGWQLIARRKITEGDFDDE